jgi:dienelactone hydrolase
MRRFAPALTALTIACLAPATADAGIIVLKSGKVLVGEITSVTKDTISIRYSSRVEGRGKQDVERHQVRWFDREVDRPTDAYWEKWHEAKIAKEWTAERERWRSSRETRTDLEVPMPGLDATLLGTRKVTFAAEDGLTISADLYGGDAKDRPLALLCHQAKSSRGEYSAIAPRLVKRGFTCLAIDQRSGQASGKIINETADRAHDAKKATGYAAARPDLEAAIAWLRAQGYTGRLLLWGSSYSASLALQVAADSEEVAAVIAFSPGEYYPPKGSVAEAAGKVKVPTLVVSTEREREKAGKIFAALATEAKTHYAGEHVLHGSTALVAPKSKKHRDAVWKAVETFLDAHVQKKAEEKPGK